jgi:hypothetical protein
MTQLSRTTDLQRIISVLLWLCAAGCAPALQNTSASRPDLRFSVSQPSVARYDFVEVSIDSHSLDRTENPFTDVSVQGSFVEPGQPAIRVDGFCDDSEGRHFKIRFMPKKVGRHTYTVTWSNGATARVFEGAFGVVDKANKGMVVVDRENPSHFLYEGSGQHYFLNSTTAYGLVGWDNETIAKAMERFARLGVNRLRVTLNWRRSGGAAWNEPNVVPGGKFTMALSPWKAERPNDYENPGYDVTSFNVDHFRKFEYLLSLARERNIVISVIPYTDGASKGTDPFGKEHMGNIDEQRYYRYIVARFAAFSNVMWDVTNEYHLFRDEPWVETMGTLIKQWDPYGHVTTVHGHDRFLFRRSHWADFASFQFWDEAGGHEFMLKNRTEQNATGRRMPQVNEEYGYEDHYPVGWGGGKVAPSRNADNRRRIAWGISMAGGYQTTGERADTGTNRAADTGGGWITGRGDDSMKLLGLHKYMVDFFSGFEWWRGDPRDDLVNNGAQCLEIPGSALVVYLPHGGNVTLNLPQGRWAKKWFDPRTGAWTGFGITERLSGTWTSPESPSKDDWALLLSRRGD